MSGHKLNRPFCLKNVGLRCCVTAGVPAHHHGPRREFAIHASSIGHPSTRRFLNRVAGVFHCRQIRSRRRLLIQKSWLWRSCLLAPRPKYCNHPRITGFSPSRIKRSRFWPRPGRKRAYARCIYKPAFPYRLWILPRSDPACLLRVQRDVPPCPANLPLMHFLFVGPAFCLQLPSDPASRRRRCHFAPLRCRPADGPCLRRCPSAITFLLSGGFGTFTR